MGVPIPPPSPLGERGAPWVTLDEPVVFSLFAWSLIQIDHLVGNFYISVRLEGGELDTLGEGRRI